MSGRGFGRNGKLLEELVMVGVRWCFLTVAVIVGTLGFQGTLADAAIVHRPVGSPFGSLTTPTDVTVDQADGNVYVTDSGANAIDVFGPEGGGPVGGIATPIAGAGAPPEGAFSFGGEISATAIDESAGPTKGDLYVSDGLHNVVDRFQFNAVKHEYEYDCQFAGYEKGCVGTGEANTWREPDGLAVDSSGNLLVTTFSPGQLYEFDASGADVQEIAAQPEPASVAVAPGGAIYLNHYRKSVVKLAAGIETIIDTNGSTAVAVDGNGNVFVDDGSFVTEYNSAAEPIERFGQGLIGTVPCTGNPSTDHCSEGIAIDDSTEVVYVSNRETGQIVAFHPVKVPDTTTGPAESIAKTTATLSGTVNPVEAGESHYYFQYGTNENYEEPHTPEGSAGTGATPLSVSANLEDLTPGVTYHYRLVTSNENGTNFGADHTFTALPAVTFKICPPPSLRGTSATLCVKIDPEGSNTDYAFAYGASEHENFFEYEFFTGFEGIGAGTLEEELTRPIIELEPATTYHYRLVAFNEIDGFSETVGNDETFTTPPAEPTVNDKPPFATGVAPHEATLNGTVGPGRGVTTYRFLYGPTAAYGSSTPEAYTQFNSNENATDHYSVEQLILGLAPETTYHYALRASNASGTTTGPDQTFTTLRGRSEVLETVPGQTTPPILPLALLQPSTPTLLAAVVFAVEASPSASLRTLTRAQKLAKALRQCAKQPKGRRAVCVKRAKTKYGLAKGERR